MTRSIRRGAKAGFIATVFVAGYLLGTLGQPAQAQLGGVGKDLMKEAGQGSGPLAQAAQLGTTITDMEESVAKLQKNLEVLNKIKAALGG